MKTAEYEKLVATARQRTQEKIETAKAKFGLGTYRRYEIDLPRAKIQFLDDDGAERVHADIQVAGSWSPKSASWLWAWENESVTEIARVRMAAVKAFGEENDIDMLRQSFTPCDEGEAWSMASIAAQILEADCVYRVPRPANQLFLLLFSIERTA